MTQGHTNFDKFSMNFRTIVDGIVLRGDRIVVPAKLRHRMVEIAHEGHQGQV